MDAACALRVVFATKLISRRSLDFGLSSLRSIIDLRRTSNYFAWMPAPVAFVIRVGQRTWWARRPICQTSVEFSAVKASIVSRQIDRPVYYNVSPRDASHVCQQTRVERISSGTPCKFLRSMGARGAREGSIARRGGASRSPDTVLFFPRSPLPRPNPHRERILTSTLPNFFLLLKNEPPAPAALRSPSRSRPSFKPDIPTLSSTLFFSLPFPLSFFHSFAVLPPFPPREKTDGTSLPG